MTKEYLVLKDNKVVYTPGHYDLEGAEATAKACLELHPKSHIRIVKILDQYNIPKK